MIISNNEYVIDISKDNENINNSTYKNFYDQVFYMEDYREFDLLSSYIISIHSSQANYKIAFIGSAYGGIDNCAVLEDSRLIILVDDYIVFYDLIYKSMIMKIKVIDFGSGLEMYPFDDGYIINGEVDIIKIDKLGNRVWSFSGRDIWARPSGESSINISEDSIFLTDFEGFNYHLDKWGKELS